jgi:hypothetical protein
MANFITPTSLTPYIAFDPSELRNKIIDRLNQAEVFTDQNYQGSNLSAIIDIIGYVFSTLQFYNSKVSSESMFSEAQIYENMNRIVKLINYKPIGRLTQNLPFNLTATNDLGPAAYVIPRFSYIITGGTTFTLTQDLAFSKLTSLSEDIADINNNYLLYQGTMEEYPLHTAVGIDNEVVFLNLDKNIQVDHFNIFVYVKSTSSSAWREYTRVEDRSTYTAKDNIFEIRFNANKYYEITFGDGVNGTSLTPGDQVAIYYLNINPLALNVGANALDHSNLIPFNSIQFQSIIKDTANVFGNYISSDLFNYIQLSNTFPSSNYSPEENVDSIRNNSPKIFRSQHRLVSLQDYEYFIKTNFNNLISTSSIVNNDDYLRGHLRYLYNIGLNNPQSKTLVLFNQIKFANSCNFNNIYIYSVPVRDQLYLSSPQKEYIINKINSLKTLTSQTMFMDPEYMYFDFYTKRSDGTFDTTDINNSKLIIYKNPNVRRSNSAILYDVIQVFLQTFNKNTTSLGQDINTHQLSTDILSIDGIKSLQTYRSDINSGVNEISFLVWNSKYPNDDVNVYTQTVHLDYFQFPLFNNISDLANRIEIIDLSNSIKIPEF